MSSFSSTSALRRAACTGSRSAANLAAAFLPLTTALRFLLFADSTSIFASSVGVHSARGFLGPLAVFFFTFLGGVEGKAAEIRRGIGHGQGRVVGGTWEVLRRNGAKWGAGVVFFATDRRAGEGQARACRLSMRYPFNPKNGLKLDHGLVESGHKTDKSPFHARALSRLVQTHPDRVGLRAGVGLITQATHERHDAPSTVCLGVPVVELRIRLS